MGKSEGLNQSKFRKRRNKKSKTSASSIVFGICIVFFVMLYIYAFVKATGINVPRFLSFQKQMEEAKYVDKVEVAEGIEGTVVAKEVSNHISKKEQEQGACIVRCETATGIQEIPMEDFLVLALGASIDMEY